MLKGDIINPNVVTGLLGRTAFLLGGGHEGYVRTGSAYEFHFHLLEEPVIRLRSPIRHGEGTVIGDGIVLDCIGVLARVRAVDSVDILGQKDHIRTDLTGPEHRGGVGGKIGVAGAAAEDDHLALAEIPVCQGARIGLRDLAHGLGGQDLGRLTMLLQHVLEGQGVDDGGQHPHLVGPGALHLVSAVLQAPPKVAAANHNAHLDALINAVLHRSAHGMDEGEVQSPSGVGCQGLSAELQQDPLDFLHVLRPPAVLRKSKDAFSSNWFLQLFILPKNPLFA